MFWNVNNSSKRLRFVLECKWLYWDARGTCSNPIHGISLHIFLKFFFSKSCVLNFFYNIFPVRLRIPRSSKYLQKSNSQWSLIRLSRGKGSLKNRQRKFFFSKCRARWKHLYLFLIPVLIDLIFYALFAVFESPILSFLMRPSQSQSPEQ